MTVSVGDRAPEFSLPGTGNRSYSLQEFSGSPVVLAFYPGDNTPVCTLQLNEYNKDFAALRELDAVLLAISPQGVESHEAFSEKQGGFSFPLLADTDKAVGKAYGVLGPLGFYRRSVFVIGADGIVTYVHRSITSVTFKRSDDLVEAVSKGSR